MRLNAMRLYFIISTAKRRIKTAAFKSTSTTESISRIQKDELYSVVSVSQRTGGRT